MILTLMLRGFASVMYCTVVLGSQCDDELEVRRWFEIKLDLLIEYMVIERFEDHSIDN